MRRDEDGWGGMRRDEEGWGVGVWWWGGGGDKEGWGGAAVTTDKDTFPRHPLPPPLIPFLYQYWKDVDLREHESWSSFREWLGGGAEGPGQPPNKPELYILSKSERLGARSLYDTRFFDREQGDQDRDRREGSQDRDIVLLFGSETTGVAALEESGELQELVDVGTAGGGWGSEDDPPPFTFCPPVYLEQSEKIRSFNLATAVAMVLFEVHRQRHVRVKNLPR